MVWILLFFTLLGSQSYAAGQLFFLEPYVGFSKLEVSESTSDSKDVSDNFIIGIRGGVSLGKIFMLGLDYHSGGPYQFGRLLNRATWTTKSTGLVLGADYKVIRFWYGYYPNSRIDDSANNTSYIGTSQKFGFGMQLSQKIRVNLEIMKYSLTKRNRFSTSYDFSDYDAKETNAYISIPVEF